MRRNRVRPLLQALERRVAPATFTVVNTNDSGAGSLRQAVEDANATTDVDDVVFDAGSFSSPQVITLTGGPIAVTESAAIKGPGPGLLTINPNYNSPAFRLTTASNVTTVGLSGMTLTKGYGLPNGGAVYVHNVKATINDCGITGNISAGRGGGIYVAGGGELTVRDCTVANNVANNGAGGIYVPASTKLTIQRSNITSNKTTTGDGGAVSVLVTGNVLIADSTFTGNSSPTTGGGLAFQGTVGPDGFIIRNSTFSGNSAAENGGAIGLRSLNGTLLVQNCTVSGNSAGSGKGGGIARLYGQGTISVESTVVSGNSNGIAPDIFTNGTVEARASAFGSVSGIANISDKGGNLPWGTPVLLGPLAANGGPTLTCRPLAGSPLHSRGSNAAGLSTDQRGAGFPRVLGAQVDIGALEVVDPNPAGFASVADVTGAGSTVYQFQVTYEDDTAISVSTLGTGDISVTGSNGFSATPTFVGVDIPVDGTPRTATYQMVPPGGAWDSGDNGQYVVNCTDQVQDVDGNPASPGFVGASARIGQTFTVVNTKDDGPGSLRQVVSDANAAAPIVDVIVFDPAVFATPQTIVLTTGRLSISDSVTIIGPGAALVAVNGNASDRVFHIKGPDIITVNLSGLTVTNGRRYVADGTGNGGGILVDNEIVSITGCTLTGNSAFHSGGAVYITGGELTLVNSTVRNNQGETGGGIASFANTTIIRDCVIEGNTAGSGSGLYVTGNVVTVDSSSICGNSGGEGALNVHGAGSRTVRNCTISENIGGGIYCFIVGGTFLIQNSTITANAVRFAGDKGAGIYHRVALETDVLTLQSTIVAGNVNLNLTSGAEPTPTDIYSDGTVNATYCAIGDPLNFFLTGGNNLPFGADLKLVKLLNNGGLTPTHMPGIGSPLRDAGSNPSALINDQRGGGFPRVIGIQTDIGAVESLATTPQASGTFTDVTIAGTTTQTLSVTYSDDTAIAAATIGDGDVRVTGPNGVSQLGVLIGVDKAGDGAQRTATYRITAPGGAWDVADNGTYVVTVEPGQVTDTSGNAVAPTTIGTFQVSAFNTFWVTNSDADGPGSLRQAVLDAAAKTGTADTILFDPAYFAVPRTITLTHGELLVNDSLSIFGPGAGLLTIQGVAGHRLFDISSPSANLVVQMSGLTLTGGARTGPDFADRGGAIYVLDEQVTIDGCVITKNSTVAGGGGIYVAAKGGALTLLNSMLSANQATSPTANGGGLLAADGTSLMVRNCTIADNQTGYRGGGIYSAPEGEAVIENSTISGNAATASNGSGGGLTLYGRHLSSRLRNVTISGNVKGGVALYWFEGTLPVQNSTITANQSSTAAGISADFSNSGSKLVLTSTIVAKNTAAKNADYYLDIAVFAESSALGGQGVITKYTDLGGNLPFGVDLKLGPLANNGGPTLTHALLPGSPAIDAGANPAKLPTDQRGLRREAPAGEPDIGAVELQSPPCVAGKSVTVNGGDAQRSRVTSVRIDFDLPVSLPVHPADAFQVKRQGDAALIDLTAVVSHDTATHVTLTFAGAGTEFGSLADGRYTLTVFAAKVVGEGGPLDGDCDGVGGDDFVLASAADPDPPTNIFRLFGDSDGDGDADSTDFLAFRNSAGLMTDDPGFNAAFDFGGDGDVDAFDFLQFRARFGTTLGP